MRVSPFLLGFTAFVFIVLLNGSFEKSGVFLQMTLNRLCEKPFLYK